MRGSASTFDAICTAEDIGSYKPDPRNFDYLLRHLAELGIAKAQVLHTAESLYHDHFPRRAIGLATCWIHRRAAQGRAMVPRACRAARSGPISASRAWLRWRTAHRAERGG